MTGIERLLEAADLVERDGRFYLKMTFDTWLKEIADQIERETERTCRNLSNDGDVFVCSECRNETHGFMFDDFGCTVGFGLGVGRCPNCGAKVVR